MKHWNDCAARALERGALAPSLGGERGGESHGVTDLLIRLAKPPARRGNQLEL